MNSIYAISFARTDTVFPIVWSVGRDNASYAINVTDRYAPPKSDSPKANPNKVQVRIRVWNSAKSERVATSVTVTSVKQADQTTKDQTKLSGTSPSNTADMNDMLEFELQRGEKYEMQIKNGDNMQKQVITTADAKSQLVEIRLEE